MRGCPTTWPLRSKISMENSSSGEMLPPRGLGRATCRRPINNRERASVFQRSLATCGLTGGYRDGTFMTALPRPGGKISTASSAWRSPTAIKRCVRVAHHPGAPDGDKRIKIDGLIGIGEGNNRPLMLSFLGGHTRSTGGRAGDARSGELAISPYDSGDDGCRSADDQRTILRPVPCSRFPK
jgi:hypothetical protein